MHASHPGSALPVSSGRLWFGIVAAPAAWALAELVGYVLVAQGCAWSHSGAAHYATPPAFTAFVGLTILCLLLAIAGLTIARANWRRLGRSSATRGATEPAAIGRARFLACSGMLAGALFLLGLVLMAILPLLLQSCNEVH
jgi:uncharacterized membrane protein